LGPFYISQSPQEAQKPTLQLKLPQNHMNTVTLDDNSEAQTTGDLQDSRILTEIL